MSENLTLLVFRLEGRRYGLRLSQVDRAIRAVDCTPLPGSPGAVIGVIDYRGSIVPVMSARKRFGFPDREVGPGDQLVIARTSRRTVAIVVDGTDGVIERREDEVVASETIAAGGGDIDGVLRLQDGLILIHDLDRFLTVDEEDLLDGALSRQVSHGRPDRD